MLLKIYKRTISVLLNQLFGKGCRFYPTCSEYAQKAVRNYGVFKGFLLTGKRILSCHSFSKADYFDPV